MTEMRWLESLREQTLNARTELVLLSGQDQQYRGATHTDPDLLAALVGLQRYQDRLELKIKLAGG